MSGLKLNEFQRMINDRWPHKADQNWQIPVLGLAGEAGEVCDEFKKGLRYEEYEYSGLKGGVGLTIDQRRANVCEELGDLLHYVARTASFARLTLQEIAEFNLRKTVPNVKTPEERSRL